MARFVVLDSGNGIADLALSIAWAVTRLMSSQPPITDVIPLAPN
jgi:hypothetical protein